MNLNEFCEEAFDIAKTHGFWEDYDKIFEIKDESFRKMMLNNAIATRLHLVTCEIAEATEGLRNGDSENFKEELADVFIRMANICYGLDIDITAAISKKMAKNMTRPYKHEKQF